MAKVTKVPVQEYVYNLELNQKEAELLMCLLGKVGGHPIYSARKYADSIWDELHRHHVKPIYRTGSGELCHGYGVTSRSNGVDFVEDKHI